MVPTLASEYLRLREARGGSLPFAYMDVRRAIENAIAAGALEPGQALPGERELAKTLTLSRVTVRKAIAGLVADGVLAQRHGAGTFVAGRIVKSFSHLTSFTDDLRARGLESHSALLERRVGEVTPEEAMALGLSPGAVVMRLERLRYAGETPLAIEHSAVPQFALPDPRLVGTSLYEALERNGCRPRRALQRLRAVAFDAAQSKLLAVTAGSPGLYIERRGFLGDGRAVEFTRSWYRGDVYDFVAELQGA